MILSTRNNIATRGGDYDLIVSETVQKGLLFQEGTLMADAVKYDILYCSGSSKTAIVLSERTQVFERNNIPVRYACDVHAICARWLYNGCYQSQRSRCGNRANR